MLLALSFGLLVFSLFVLILRLAFNDKIHVNKRLKSLYTEDDFCKEEIHIRKKENGKIKILSKFKIIEKLNVELSSAGILMRAEEFLIIWILAIFVPAGIVIILSKNFITATSFIIIGTFTPLFIVKRAKKKRLEKFSVQLGDALITLGNCLKSGLSLLQGIASVGNEMPEPLGKEFTRVFREINYGISMEKAFDNLSRRIKSEELDLIISAIIIQREIGGNLSEILDKVSVTIKERLKVKEEIKVITATGRMSGVVVGALPIGIGLILMLITPEYISEFFNNPIGTTMLIIAGVMEIAGFAIIHKMVSVKY